MAMYRFRTPGRGVQVTWGAPERKTKMFIPFIKGVPIEEQEKRVEKMARGEKWGKSFLMGKHVGWDMVIALMVTPPIRER